jgi:hypothetical protein
MTKQFLGLYTIECDRLLVFQTTEIRISGVLAKLFPLPILGTLTNNLTQMMLFLLNELGIYYENLRGLPRVKSNRDISSN